MNNIFPTRIALVSAALLVVYQCSAQNAPNALPPRPTPRSTGGAGGALAGPNGIVTWSDEGVNPEQMLRQAEEATRAALQNADPTAREAAEQALQNLHSSMNKLGKPSTRAGVMRFTGVTHDEAPALVLTSPMEKKQRDELQEDLRVMDQLLRDELKHQNANDARRAMGIRLLVSDRVQSAPMYVEGYGVILNCNVNIPLAGAEKTEASTPEDPPAGSAWDRAKRELQKSSRGEAGGSMGGGNGNNYSYSFNTGPGGAGVGAMGDVMSRVGPTPPYNPDRVDALVDAIYNSLNDAKNIRHLKPTDAVTITVGGTDEAGGPVRLTFKALKADIDKLAEGKMTAEDFRKKVVRNGG